MGQLYADKEQMLKRYRAEDIADLTQDDETRLNAVLASTSALIDGYVAPRYRLPLQNKHDILTDAACDIAYYKLYYVDVPEGVRQRYEDAVSLQLQPADLSLQPQRQVKRVFNPFRRPRFGRALPDDYRRCPALKSQ